MVGEARSHAEDRRSCGRRRLQHDGRSREGRLPPVDRRAPVGAGSMAGESRPARRPQRWFEVRRPVPARWVCIPGVAAWGIFLGLWVWATAGGLANDLLLPPPHVVAAKLVELLSSREFAWDIVVSILRILASFAAACVIALPLGLLMGSFPTVEAF